MSLIKKTISYLELSLVYECGYTNCFGFDIVHVYMYICTWYNDATTNANYNGTHIIKL